MNDRTGNLPPLPGIFPDYPEPIVRNQPSVSWCVGTGSFVLRAVGEESIAEGEAFIGGAVISRDALHRDTLAFEPSKTAVEACCGVFPALAWQQLGLGHTRAVIDGDVRVFPAETASC
jgi:hypothetical protein